MINVTIGTNTSRKTIITPIDSKIKDVLEQNEVNTAGAAIHLNGSLLSVRDLTETFEALGITEDSNNMLIAVVKADSAA